MQVCVTLKARPLLSQLRWTPCESTCIHLHGSTSFSGKPVRFTSAAPLQALSRVAFRGKMSENARVCSAQEAMDRRHRRLLTGSQTHGFKCSALSAADLTMLDKECARDPGRQKCQMLKPKPLGRCILRCCADFHLEQTSQQPAGQPLL